MSLQHTLRPGANPGHTARADAGCVLGLDWISSANCVRLSFAKTHSIPFTSSTERLFLLNVAARVAFSSLA
jgi:hypothetical protein